MKLFLSTLKPFYFLIFLVFISSINILAQPGSVSVEEVEIQKIFLEATKERILDRYENATVLYKEILKRDRTNHASAYELARVYEVLEEDDKALSSAKIAVSLDPSNVWYQMLLADIYHKVRKNKDAAEIYKKLIDADPENEFYYSKRAFYLIAANEAEAAIKVYNAHEKKFGISEEAARKKHSLYIGLGNEKKAVKELQKLANSFPYNLEYQHLLAGYYQLKGQKEKAKVIYKKILSIDPNNAKASLALLDSNKASSGRDADYLNSLKAIFLNENADIDTKVKKLIPFIQRIADGDKDAPKFTNSAIELAQILEQIHPNEAKSFSAHGDLLYYSGNKKEALKKYQKAIELDNSVFAIWEQILYINTELNDIDALLKNSSEAIDLFPNKSKAYYFNGLANSEKGNYAEAINVFNEALLMSGKNIPLQVDLYFRLGESYFELEKFDKSYASFEKALSLNPKNNKALTSYSYALAEQGVELEKAKEMAERSNQLKPNNPNTEAAYAWIFYKLKQYEQSKKWFEKSLKNGGDQLPKILENYGDVLFQLNDIDNAILQWQKAQAKGSHSSTLEKKIADRQLYD